MFLRLVVDVEVAKAAGPFASKDAIGTELVDQLIDPGAITVSGINADSEYEVVSWEVGVE